MIKRITNWFRVQRWRGEPHLQASERIGALGRQIATENNEVLDHTAACLNFLAVLCGTEDKERLHESGFIMQRFATEALNQYETPEPEPEETLRRLTERGIDIVCGAARERKWDMVAEGLAKVIFLDELSRKVANGEEVLKKQPEVEWPDIVGER